MVCVGMWCVFMVHVCVCVCVWCGGDVSVCVCVCVMNLCVSVVRVCMYGAYV